MVVIRPFHQLKTGTGLLADGGCIILTDFQVTASGRSPKGKGSDDPVAIFDHRLIQELDIPGSILCVGEKMKNSTVMPDVVLSKVVHLRDITLNPGDFRGKISQSILGLVQGLLRDVQNCQLGVASV